MRTGNLRLKARQRRNGIRYVAYCRSCWDWWGLYREEMSMAEGDTLVCDRCDRATKLSRRRLVKGFPDGHPDLASLPAAALPLPHLDERV